MKRWLGVVAALAIWELVTSLHWISPFVIVAPSALVRVFGDMLASGDLARHVSATMGRVAVAVLIGGTPGLCLGLAAGIFRSIREPLEPLINALNAIPKVALLPLAIVTFGTGEGSRNVPGILTCFTLMAIHGVDAVRAVNPALVELGRNYGAHGLSLFHTVYLPSCLPQIATGLRVSLSVSLVVVVSCEMLGAEQGLGSLIWTAGQSFSTERLYAGLLTCGALGGAMVIVLKALERKLAPWTAR